MKLDRKFSNSPSIDLSIFSKASSNNTENLIGDLIKAYDEELSRGKLSTSYIKTYQMLLYNEYQRQKTDEKSSRIIINLSTPSDLFVNLSLFKPEELSIILEIIILKLVIFDSTSIFKNLNIFQSKFSDALNDKTTRILYLTTIECFLDAFALLKFNNRSVKIEKLEYLHLVSQDMKYWYKVKTNSDWKSLISLLPKILNVTSLEFLRFFWDLLLQRTGQELEDCLTGLCIFVNSNLKIYTASEVERNSLQSFISDKKLWKILHEGLSSRKQSNRKQAMYLFKILTEFIEREKLKETSFACLKNRAAIEHARITFIMILESLEEKQQHLVIPSLSSLETLIKICSEHKKCENCFDPQWLSCILINTLQHENSAVVKWGISFVLLNYLKLQNDQLFQCIVESLNNRFLYERPNGMDPLISADLKIFFHNLMEMGDILIKNFLSEVSRISWDPVSIWNVTKVLRQLKFEKNTRQLFVSFPWNENEMSNNIKSLVDKNLKRHNLLLRTESQVNVIFILTFFTENLNLRILTDIFSVFPRGEAFSKRTPWWTLIVNCIREIMEQNNIRDRNVDEFVGESCSDIYRGSSETNIESFARMLAILLDLNFIRRGDKSLNLLHDLLSHISSLDTRPYADRKLADRIFHLISHLNFLSNPSDIYDFLNLHLESAILFVILQLKEDNLSNDNVHIYSEFLDSVISNDLINEDRKLVTGNFLIILKLEAISCLKDGNDFSILRQLLAVNILRILNRKAFELIHSDVISQLLVNFNSARYIRDCHLAEAKGRETTELLAGIADIIDYYLEVSEEIVENDWFSNTVSLFEKSELKGLPHITGIALKIMQKGLIQTKYYKEVESLIRALWRTIFESRKNPLFWAAFDQLLKLILDPVFLKFENGLLNEFIREILKEGEVTPNLKNQLLKNLENINIKLLVRYQATLLNCALHGRVLRRDEKIEMDTLENLSPADRVRDVHLINCSNSVIRARAIILIYKLAITIEHFTASFLPLILKLLPKYRGKRYFNNSNTHRELHRIFQLLLILEPRFDEELSKMLETTIKDIIISNADQYSIQLMMSWILVKILFRKCDKSSLWILLKEVKEKRPNNLKIIAGIILHISRLMEVDDVGFKTFFEDTIENLAPECFGPVFNTRLACQVTVKELYEKANIEDNLYRAIATAMNEQKTETLEVFYYKYFNAVRDYCLESIFVHIPRLTNLSQDEIIVPEIFMRLGFIEDEKHQLKLFSDDENSLKYLNNPWTVIKNYEDLEKNKISMINIDCQKKIVPKKLSDLQYYELQELNNEIKMEEKEGIIVVASLIEKIPNLGGIARTCEIFGATELVLASKQFMENKEFQSLSVTAEKWIRVSEIQPQNLPNYLLGMQNIGWRLVGLEQTAHCSSILEEKFNKKTLLILGNEKSGIPPHIIPMLDICIEIPQVGLIRSLNVHVAGAICIWEYAKQYLFN